jgi:hypothetical protein
MNIDTSLTIIGYAPISKANIPISVIDQVSLDPKLLTQSELLIKLAQLDLNLSPLDIESAFNHGKSALKLVHAGAVGVRTLSSRTDELTAVGEELGSGYCVPAEESWLSYLSAEKEQHSRGEVDRGALQRRTLEMYGYASFLRSFKPIISELMGH